MSLASRDREEAAHLGARFGTVSPELEERIANTSDLPTLMRWIRAAATIPTPDDLPL